MYLLCQSCGNKVELAPGEPPCKALNGWLTVSQWKGSESVDHYSFCSFSCFQRWVNSRATTIPEVFLKALEEENDDL